MADAIVTTMVLDTDPPNRSDSASRSIERRRRESGQSLLEVALLTPMLLVLLLGAVDLGRYASFAIQVGNAARAGADYGAQNRFAANDPNGITTAVCQDFSGQNSCTLSVSSGYVCECDDNGTMSTIACATGSCPTTSPEVVSLAVTASGSFSWIFAVPGVIPPSITVTRTATQRIGN